MRAVAAIPAIGLLAGAACGLLLPDMSLAGARTLLCAALIVAVWAWCAARSRALAAGVCVGFFAGGAMLSASAWQSAWRPPLRAIFEELARSERATAAREGRTLPEDNEAFAIVEGVVRTDAALTATGASLSVLVDRVEAQNPPNPPNLNPSKPGHLANPANPVLGGIIVTVIGSIAPLRYGDWRAGRRVRFPVQLQRPARYLDPGVPDHERALALRGTTLVGTVKSGALVEIVSKGSWIEESLAGARAHARRAIAAEVGRWSSRSAAIVAAIVIGDRAGLDDELQRRLQEAGTYHVIAISGGNIAILAGLLIGAFRLAGILGRGAMMAAMALLIAYAALVGGGASVDRATSMAVVYLGARVLDHRSPPLNSLALVAACLVTYDPLTVADAAFLLTFGATLGLLVSLPEVQRKPSPALVRHLVVVLTASAAAEVILLPIGAAVFSRVTFAGLALNFLAIPLMGVAQIAGMAVVPLASVSSWLAASCGFVAHVGAEGLVRSADLVRFMPVTWRVAAPNVAVIVAYYVALASWCVLRHRARLVGSAESRRARTWRRRSALIAVAAGVWIVAEPWTLLAARGDGRLHVTFLDVGQGDSVFLRFPHGASLLVDTGGLIGSSTFDIGDRVVAPVLREAGLRRLDRLALTHGDPDHIGGARSVLAEFRPAEIWEGIPVPRLEALSALRAQAMTLGAQWTEVRRGGQFVVDDVEIRVLHPEDPDWERQKVRNDDSIVLDLRWREMSMLLAGDIGREVERGLPALPRARLRIVKVPHHGSLTSSTEDFVRATRPTVAVFSAGRSNHFGHPAPAVVERYRSIGAEIFRTDRDGAVTVDTDGHSLNVHTVLGR